MAVVTSGNWQKSLWPGVDHWFNEAYDEWETEYTNLFSTKSSGKQFEQAVGMSLLGLPSQKGQGEGINYDDTQQTYINQYNNIVYALGTVITLEAYRDNQYNIEALSDKPQSLAFSMRQGKEHIGANVLNNGFNSNFTMGSSSDGVELFSSAHLSGPYGANRSNIGTAADLSETALEDMLVQIAQAVDPRGLKIKLMADKLVIPPALLFEAERILASSLQNDTANNAVNAIRSQSALPGGKTVNHYLTDADAWFITTNLNKQGKGLVHYDAWPTEFGMDNDFDTFNMKCKAFFRCSFGWSDFQGCYGNAGA
jgi:hypothetical protein